METKNYSTLQVSSAPHLVTTFDTQKTMLTVLIALIPALCVSIYEFGPRVLALTIVCIGFSVLFEAGWNKLFHKEQTVQDCSAMLTGTLIAYNVPASMPYWMAIIGCFVAIIIVKQLYGGIGRNFANPAIVARIVLFVSFANQMNSWPLAKGAGGTYTPLSLIGKTVGVDTTTGATPLGALGDALKAADTPANADLSALPDNLQMFLGDIGGSVGEISAIALLIGGAFLVWRKVISPIIPCCFVATVFVIAFLYYSVTGGPGGYSALEMAIFHICAGGVMLGAIFMATDYVTSPIMPLGKVIMGIGCGFFTMVIRLWAAYPEGVSFSILLMNIMTPHIDNLCIRLTYGGGKKND